MSLRIGTCDLSSIRRIGSRWAAWRLVLCAVMFVSATASPVTEAGPQRPPAYLNERNRPQAIRDTYCGAYVVWHALHHFGIRQSIDAILKEMCIDRSGGTTLGEICRALKGYGLSADAVKLEVDRIRDMRRPFIPYICRPDTQEIAHVLLCIPAEDAKLVIVDGPMEPRAIEADLLRGLGFEMTGWDGTAIIVDRGFHHRAYGKTFLWGTALLMLAAAMILQKLRSYFSGRHRQ